MSKHSSRQTASSLPGHGWHPWMYVRRQHSSTSTQAFTTPNHCAPVKKMCKWSFRRFTYGNLVTTSPSSKGIRELFATHNLLILSRGQVQWTNLLPALFDLLLVLRVSPPYTYLLGGVSSFLFFVSTLYFCCLRTCLVFTWDDTSHPYTFLGFTSSLVSLHRWFIRNNFIGEPKQE